MSLRIAAKVDNNQAEIVRALRQVGCSVLLTFQLKNCFDILVGYRGRTFIMEIKDPNQPPSKRKLTEGEEEFRQKWRGSTYHIVETPDQAIAIVTAKNF